MGALCRFDTLGGGEERCKTSNEKGKEVMMVRAVLDELCRWCYVYTESITFPCRSQKLAKVAASPSFSNTKSLFLLSPLLLVTSKNPHQTTKMIDSLPRQPLNPLQPLLPLPHFAPLTPTLTLTPTPPPLLPRRRADYIPIPSPTNMIHRRHIRAPSLLPLELLVEMEDGALLVPVVHVACAAAAGGVVGAWVGLGGVVGREVGDGGWWGQFLGGGGAFGGHGGRGADAGAAAAEGHGLDVVVVGEGLVEGVAGHCWYGLWCLSCLGGV